MGQPRKGVTAVDRFFGQITTKNCGSCWIWTGADDGNYGYGQIKAYGKKWKAHRFSWELFYGKISKGMYVCHKCDVARCVNPDHLFLGTAKDNAIDSAQKGRNHLSKRLFCPQGHPYNEKNTLRYRCSGGRAGYYRACRVCRSTYHMRNLSASAKRSKEPNNNL